MCLTLFATSQPTTYHKQLTTKLSLVVSYWLSVKKGMSNKVRHTFSTRKAVYNPKAFILHAASLGQAFAHCRIFSTAASRRSLDSVSVPMLGIALSRPLPVIALVVHYTTNKLIGHRLLPKR